MIYKPYWSEELEKAANPTKVLFAMGYEYRQVEIDGGQTLNVICAPGLETSTILDFISNPDNYPTLLAQNVGTENKNFWLIKDTEQITNNAELIQTSIERARKVLSGHDSRTPISVINTSAYLIGRHTLNDIPEGQVPNVEQKTLLDLSEKIQRAAEGIGYTFDTMEPKDTEVTTVIASPLAIGQQELTQLIPELENTGLRVWLSADELANNSQEQGYISYNFLPQLEKFLGHKTSTALVPIFQNNQLENYLLKMYITTDGHEVVIGESYPIELLKELNIKAVWRIARRFAQEFQQIREKLESIAYMAQEIRKDKVPSRALPKIDNILLATNSLVKKILKLKTLANILDDSEIEDPFEDIESLVRLAESKRITHELNIDLPIEYNPLISIVIRELSENAILNALPGEKSQVRAEIEEGQVVIRATSVSDDQIPDTDIDLLTVALFRLTPSRPAEKGGYGLGLTLVEAIRELLRGELRIESNENNLTTVTFTAPLSSEEQS